MWQVDMRDHYASSASRNAAFKGNQFYFFQEFRNNGGTFFDPKTMKSQINSAAGVKTMRQLIDQNKASIPSVLQMDAVAEWTAWVQGKLAFIFSWPPTGRLSENYSQRSKSFSFIPTSHIVGKVRYTLLPTGHGEFASGYVKAITSDSKYSRAIDFLNSATSRRMVSRTANDASSRANHACARSNAIP